MSHYGHYESASAWQRQLPALGETLAFREQSVRLHSRPPRPLRRRLPHQHPGQADGVHRRPEMRRHLARSGADRARGRDAGQDLLALFGGSPDIVPLLDGERHAQRKRSLLAAFSPEAIASYLPGLQGRIEVLLARWLAISRAP